MKSSFSRNFSMAATILLLTLTILGASFQIQINSFLEDTTVSRLTQDSQVVANLAGAYGMDGNLASRDLMLNLDVVSQITNADLVICDNDGYIILCSGSLNGCAYDGWQLNQDFLDKVYENGGYSATGTICNLYDEERYVVSAPIVSGEQRLGIVIVSTPTAGTKQVLNKISNIFLTVSVFVVLIAVLGVMAFARRESKPLKELAKAATAFGHGELDARVKIDEDSSEEMEELALAFNNMASSLQKSEYQRQEFVANVSHDHHFRLCGRHSGRHHPRGKAGPLSAHRLRRDKTPEPSGAQYAGHLPAPEGAGHSRGKEDALRSRGMRRAGAHHL